MERAQQPSFTQEERKRIRILYQQVLTRIRTVHIKPFPDHPQPLFLISDTYPGVWLEHVYDAVCWADLEPSMSDVAKSQVRLFIEHQKADGQLPCFVLDTSNPHAANYPIAVGYGQIQECVSFTKLCLDVFEQTGDTAFLRETYEACVRWDRWLVSHRMTQGSGLIELFCEFDTGHDNSRRLAGLPQSCPNGDAGVLGDGEVLPLYAPDMNAVFYGSRRALAQMAVLLGRQEEASVWQQRASDVKQALFQICYDGEDAFFYDVDRMGQKRKFRSILIANLFQEHVLDGEVAERIYETHLKNPAEFWTPYPFPSMAISDPASVQDRDGNSWGFYSQGLTALRALRWMDAYGKGADLEIVMERWIRALIQPGMHPFSQELHPITGVRSNSSSWYSSSMLFFLHAVRRLGLV